MMQQNMQEALAKKMMCPVARNGKQMNKRILRQNSTCAYGFKPHAMGCN
jgi:hypothetical protein